MKSIVDDSDKQKFESDLRVIEASLFAVTAQSAAAVSISKIPIMTPTGPVQFQGMDQMAKAVEAQNSSVRDLLRLVEKLFKEISS